MSPSHLPPPAAGAPLPSTVTLKICSSAAEPPAGGGWLHELKHDGHRVLVIANGRGGLRLISRNGYDRTDLFRAPFDGIAQLGRELVLDGEIAVPDERGVTHISDIQEAVARRQGERFAYFAFDLLHLDGHDLRGCPIEDRKGLLEAVLASARCPRVLYVSHVLGGGGRLFEAARRLGVEGIVSKKLGSRYRGGPSRDWLKTKVSATGTFVVTGFKKLSLTSQKDSRRSFPIVSKLV